MIGIFTLLIDRTLGERYRLDALLGTGGMGAIYRAHDLKLQREVAVKVMTATAADPHDQRTLRERFHREARSAARLKHPNVVTVHDFGTDAVTGIDYLVMEMLHGADLAARLRRVGSLAVPEAIHIAQSAALGLGAGHHAGMVHRDVKPANLFLLAGSYAPRVKLLDFGIAQLISDVETRLTRAGTPHTPRYASPEQLLGSMELTPASDVFSLGITLLEALAGEYPEGVNSGQRDPVEIIASGQGAFDRHVPRQLLAALEGALDLDPATRIANANAFLAVLNSEGSSHDNASELYAHRGSGAANTAAVSGAAAPSSDVLSDAPAGSATAAADLRRVGSSSDSNASSEAGKNPRTDGGVASPLGHPRAATPNAPATHTRAARWFVRRPAALGVALVLIIGSGAILRSRNEVPSAITAAQPEPEPVDMAKIWWVNSARFAAQRAMSSAQLQIGDSAWVLVVQRFGQDFHRADGRRMYYHSSDHEATVANPLVYPELEKDEYAVIVGPYRTRAEAERAQKQLGREGLRRGELLRVTLHMPPSLY